ncbi:RtcB family protein, partial [Verrucomicrobiales bacterium]|nr:RtcB family protein [Verrucomicrobiales bacterium]
MIDEDDLLRAGWPAGDALGELLSHARWLEKTKGISDSKYLLKLLRRDFPPPAKPTLREEPAPSGEAITATTPEEIKNLGAVRRQMGELLRVPVISRGSLMPDACPAGSAPATIPVGGVIAIENAIIPSAHSSDICCSMFATFYRSDLDTTTQLDALVAATRFGPGGRPADDLVPHPVLDEDIWENPFLKGLENKATIHMADQGDGNHFAYLGKIEISSEQAQQSPLPEGNYSVLVTHHGSRGLGASLFTRGQKAAVKHTAKVAQAIPESAAWLDAESQQGQDYWEALQYIGRWTRANHESIHQRFLTKIESTPEFSFGNEHNFVWKRGSTYLHGKGATPAWKDDDGRPLLGIVPLNMAEPILIILGKDNPDFLSFAPHGAGRNQSRTALVRKFLKKGPTALADS